MQPRFLAGANNPPRLTHDSVEFRPAFCGSRILTFTSASQPPKYLVFQHQTPTPPLGSCKQQNVTSTTSHYQRPRCRLSARPISSPACQLSAPQDASPKTLHAPASSSIPASTSSRSVLPVVSTLSLYWRTVEESLGLDANGWLVGSAASSPTPSF